MVKELDIEEVLVIHSYLTEWFADSDDPISPPGIKNQGMLESAIGRPFQSVGGVEAYSPPFEQAAALFHSIIANHPFHNGNKRTALTTACVFLDLYGYWLDRCGDEEMFEFTRQVAGHEICTDRENEVNVIASWFEEKSRKRDKRDYRLKFGELKSLLSSHGFEMDQPNASFIGIYKDGEFVTKVKKKGIHGQEDYDPAYVHDLRKRLNLTPDYGIDSIMFYGAYVIQESVAEFVNIRAEVVRKLAQT